MLESALVVFREALEVALIVGVILRLEAGLQNFTKLKKTVYLGVLLGLITSILAAVLFQKVAGGFSGRAEEIFEGIIFLIGAATLASVILWLKHEQAGSGQLNEKAKKLLETEEWWGMFLLVFFSVVRDGVETILYLGAAGSAGNVSGVVGALIGLVVAVGLGYAVFAGTKKINVKKFFTITSILLLLFAVSLLIRGLGEFAEAGLLPSAFQLLD